VAVTLFVSPYILSKPEEAGVGSFAGASNALLFDSLEFAAIKFCQQGLLENCTHGLIPMMSVFVSVVFLVFEALSPPPLGPLLLRKLSWTLLCCRWLWWGSCRTCMHRCCSTTNRKRRDLHCR